MYGCDGGFSTDEKTFKLLLKLYVSAQLLAPEKEMLEKHLRQLARGITRFEGMLTGVFIVEESKVS